MSKNQDHQVKNKDKYVGYFIERTLKRNVEIAE